jgi:hypothetical protein
MPTAEDVKITKLETVYINDHGGGHGPHPSRGHFVTIVGYLLEVRPDPG